MPDMQDKTVDTAQDQSKYRKSRKAKQDAKDKVNEYYKHAPKDNDSNLKILESLKRKNYSNKDHVRRKRVQANQKFVYSLENHGTFLFAVCKEDTNHRSSSKSSNTSHQIRETNVGNGNPRQDAVTARGIISNQVQRQDAIHAGGIINNCEQEQPVIFKRGDCLLLNGGQVVIVVESLQHKQSSTLQTLDVQIFASGKDVGILQLGAIPEVYLTGQTKKICQSEVCRKVVLHFNKLEVNTEYVCRYQYSLKTKHEHHFKPVSMESWLNN